MSHGFLARRLLGLGLTANALRPLPGLVSGATPSIPAFFAGWLTTEMAPQLLALTVADTVTHLARHGRGGRADRLGLGLAVASMAGLGALVAISERSEREVQDALCGALGEDYALGADPELPSRRLDHLLWPLPGRHHDVVKVADLPYAPPGDRRHRLNVFHRRDRPTGRPALLQVHGGGWAISNKDQQGLPLMRRMAEHGWVCFAANYPLSPKARWPEHLVALKQAIGWIREHGAEYGADPSFLAVTGGSAGGHLAALLALTANDPRWQPGFEQVDTSVQACVPYYGIYDFAATTGTPASVRRRDGLLAKVVVGKDPARYVEEYRAASPLDQVGPDAPPFFVLHGSNDLLVPVAEARLFVDRLRAVSSNPVAYAELIGAQHAFDVFPSIRSAHVVAGVQRFLDWAYRNRD
jgi:acetyl esterase/lipase